MDLDKMDKILNDIAVIKADILVNGVNQNVINAVNKYRQDIKDALQSFTYSKINDNGVDYAIDNMTLNDITNMVDNYRAKRIAIIDKIDLLNDITKIRMP